MSWSLQTLLVVLLPAMSAGPVASGPDTDEIKADEKLLRTFHLEVDGPSLVDFFRQRAAGASSERIAALIIQLGDADDKRSDQAFAALLAIGPTAAPALQQAVKSNPKSSAVPKFKQCLSALEGPARTSIPLATAQLLAARKPAGAMEALLAYYALVEDEGAASEIRDCLEDLALRDGKADPALVAALADKHSARRAVAAELLMQVDARVRRPAVRALLKDPDANVRLRVALALADLRDRDAIPVLIALLEELPQAQGRQAEEALLLLAESFAPKVRLENHEAGRKKCREAWAEWWKSSDGPELRDYFRRRTLSDADEKKVAALIRALGRSSFKSREEATAELIALRRLAVPLLKEALKEKDAEVQRRGKFCLEQLALAAEAPRSLVNVRLLTLRHPGEATDVLLAFIPFADNDAVEDEIRAALVTLARVDAATHKPLLARLTDKFPQRRAAAAEALAQGGVNDHLPAVRKLLKDADPLVRLRVAQALAVQKERDSIPILIALLTELPLDQARQAEDMLHRLADAKAPTIALSAAMPVRQKCRDAWTAWWEASAAKVDLARLSARNRLLGYTVLARWNWNGNTNEIVELGANGQERWKIDGLGYTFDFQLLPGQKILMVENNLNRVTERNFKGDILWEFKVTYPQNCQRLLNGNTFIAGNNEVLEVDRSGTVVYRVQMGNMSARKLSDGRIAVLLNNGVCNFIDTTGKVLKSVNVGGGVSNMGGMDTLPNGGVLLTLRSDNKVVELDADGKVVWHVIAKSPNMATRLPNGNTLITSQDQRCAEEVDRTGRVVWEHRPNLAICGARRR